MRFQPQGRGRSRRRMVKQAQRAVVFGAVFIVAAFATSAAQSGGAPIRPGIRQADQAEAQTEKNIPPPAAPHTSVDLKKLSAEADELSKIAQTIPNDVASVRGGTLPKDILQKLKQIEKLSKHLRGELER